MTTNKHAKQLVRARMATTGETYTQASAYVRSALTDIHLDDPLTVDAHGKHGQTVVFVPDGTRLLSGGQDARIAVTDPRTGQAVGELLGHQKVVNAVATDTRASVLVSVSSDRTVRNWDLAGQRPTAVLEGHKDAVVALALSSDGSQAVTGGYDGRLRRWDLERGECIDERSSQLKRIAAIAITPDGNHTLESGQGPLVVIRNAVGEPTAELDTGSPGVIGLGLAPDGAILATAGYDGKVGLWSCDTWELLRELPVGAQTNAVAFSRDGQLLAAAAAGRIIVWSHQEDDPIATYDLPMKGVYALAFSGDSRRLAQTGADGKVRIFTLR